MEMNVNKGTKLKDDDARRKHAELVRVACAPRHEESLHVAVATAQTLLGHGRVLGGFIVVVIYLSEYKTYYIRGCNVATHHTQVKNLLYSSVSAS